MTWFPKGGKGCTRFSGEGAGYRKAGLEWRTRRWKISMYYLLGTLVHEELSLSVIQVEVTYLGDVAFLMSIATF